MSTWARTMPRPPRCLRTTARAVCSEQLPAREARCGFSAPEKFQFSVKMQDVAGRKKVRIDSFLSGNLPEVSRARLKSSIQDGLVTVNRTPQTKPAYGCKVGDVIVGSLPEPPGTTAEPEDIPLSVAFEDEHLLVVNKAAGMVVHPSPGHYTGTLVNAVLHHYSLPAISLQHEAHLKEHDNASDLASRPPREQEDKINCDEHDDDDDLASASFALPPNKSESVAVDSGTEESTQSAEQHVASQVLPQNGNAAVLRPGIVHRLDKGTTGLMVVCRSPVALLRLGEQFRARSINRLYYSITVGVPAKASGEICTNIDRHPTDRLRMAVYGFGSTRGREAISTYRVLETIGEGVAALVEWKLHTGRTHQIRVHAQHIGCPLFGDRPYDGFHRAYSKIGRGDQQREKVLGDILASLDRPALHAKTLGFMHPTTGQELQFDSDLPPDLSAALEGLKSLPAC